MGPLLRESNASDVSEGVIVIPIDKAIVDHLVDEGVVLQETDEVTPGIIHWDGIGNMTPGVFHLGPPGDGGSHYDVSQTA
jgi:hypothetical protein